MATVTIKHGTLTGATANPAVLVDGPKWDAAHTVTGLENVDNTSDVNKPVSTAQAAADAVVAANAANASNLTSGTAPAARMPALTGDVTTVAGAVATTIAANAVTNAKAAQMAANTVKGNNTGALANAADLTGAQVEQMLLFTQTGGTQRTVDGKLKDIVSIKDFGGVGDGVTDNTAALNAALAALTGAGGGIYFPPGKYRFNSAISFNLPAGVFSVTLLGSGQDATILYWPNASGGMTFNYSNQAHSTHFRDFSITTGQNGGGTAIAFTQTAPLGYFAQNDFFRITVRGDTTGVNYWSFGFDIYNVSGTSVDTVTMYGNGTGGTGIYYHGTGVGGTAGNNYSIYHNVSKSTFNALNIGLNYGTFAQGLTVGQCNFQNGVISIFGPAGALGNAQIQLFDNQFAPGNYAGADCIQLNSTQAGVFITSNYFFPIGTNTGINLSQNVAIDAIISGNIFSGSTAPSGNQIVLAGGGPTLVNGNRFSLTTGTGLWLKSTSSNVLVVDNIFSASVTTPILNQGASNVIRNNVGYNPVGASNITVGASPFTYTAGASPETVYIFGGTVSNVSLVGGVFAATSSPCSIDLGPGEQVQVTYSVLPNMTKMVH